MTGTVSRLTDFGAFVELLPGVMASCTSLKCHGTGEFGIVGICTGGEQQFGQVWIVVLARRSVKGRQRILRRRLGERGRRPAVAYGLVRISARVEQHPGGDMQTIAILRNAQIRNA